MVFRIEPAVIGAAERIEIANFDHGGPAFHQDRCPAGPRT
jgi:hypothetical protein